MPYHQCSVAGCRRTAWRPCARCGQPFCDSHASWHQTEFTQDRWARWATFTFACYDCVPRSVGDDVEWPDRAVGAGMGSGYQLSRQAKY